MGKFLLKALLMLCPAYVITGVFVITDPFGIIYTGEEATDPVFRLTASYWNTCELKSIEEEDRPNAFVLGNSKGYSYDLNDWASRLPDSANPFYFNGYGEAIYGVRQKMRYLDRNGYNISYAIFLFGGTLRKVDPPKEVVTLHHPEVSGLSWIDFWGKHLQAYFSLFPQHLYSILFENDANNNADDLPAEIYEKRKERYKAQKRQTDSILTRMPSTSVPFQKSRPISLSKKSVHYLFDIAKILVKHKTNYRILLTPRFHGMKQSIYDLLFLKAVFNPRYIWDFTRDARFVSIPQFYPGLPVDKVHYHRAAGDAMMEIIYAPHAPDTLATPDTTQ